MLGTIHVIFRGGVGLSFWYSPRKISDKIRAFFFGGSRTGSVFQTSPRFSKQLDNSARLSRYFNTQSRLLWQLQLISGFRDNLTTLHLGFHDNFMLNSGFLNNLTLNKGFCDNCTLQQNLPGNFIVNFTQYTCSQADFKLELFWPVWVNITYFKHNNWSY